MEYGLTTQCRGSRTEYFNIFLLTYFFQKHQYMRDTLHLSDPWLCNFSARERSVRLYCFAYAGGNAYGFSQWQFESMPLVEISAVQLPGRGARLQEIPITDFACLIDALVEVMARQPTVPFAFFGHSLGALVAFELTRRLRQSGMAVPARLIVSGCGAPRLRGPGEGLHLLDDAGLLAKLRELNGTPPEILAHQELMELLLPTIRADMELVDNYRYCTAPPLSMPITVLAGRQDEFDVGEIECWSEETTAPCRVEWFDGDHFFINSARSAVLDCIGAELSAVVAEQARTVRAPLNQLKETK
jgi:surfactin synthase thioesterase subunit